MQVRGEIQAVRATAGSPWCRQPMRIICIPRKVAFGSQLGPRFARFLLAALAGAGGFCAEMCFVESAALRASCGHESRGEKPVLCRGSFRSATRESVAR